MTTVVLTTSDLIGSTGSVTQTGGNAEDTLDDGNDATGLTLVNTTSTGFQASMSLGTFTLGTGRLKSWFVTYRRALTAGVQVGLTTSIGSEAANDFGLMPQLFETVTTTAYANPPVTVVSAAQVPPGYTQAMIDAMSVTFYADPGTGGTVLVTEMSVSATYAVAPTANITYPTGTPAITATSSPVITWTHAGGSDGGPKVAHEIKVYTAAQYGAGGFSPDTSTPDYTSGMVPSSATSAAVGPLANSTTFRVYVRTAQSINSAYHWSAWDFEGFTTNYTTSSITSVTPVATSASGYITVTVARNTGTETWDYVEVQRTDDGGTTWVPVRGATYVAVGVTNTFVTTFSSSSLVARDYEAPNGTTVTYRARAITNNSGSDVAGPWASSSTTSWSSTSSWLKDPHDPTLNLVVTIREQPNPTRTLSQGVFNVINAEMPVVVSDTRRGRVGTFVAQTATNAAGLLFDLAIENPVKLLQFPASHQWGSKYIVLNDTQEMHIEPTHDLLFRRWQVAFTEIALPADQTDY